MAEAEAKGADDVKRAEEAAATNEVAVNHLPAADLEDPHVSLSTITAVFVSPFTILFFWSEWLVIKERHEIR